MLKANKEQKIAVIGAGIAGSYLAFKLDQAGFQVEVYEKSRGTGGRTASKRWEQASLDFGAQFIEANNPDFKNFLLEQSQTKTVIEWKNYKFKIYDKARNKITGDIFPDNKNLYLANPKMTSLCKELCKDLQTHFQNKVIKVSKAQNNQVTVYSETESGPQQENFDWVISTAPPAQSREIFVEFEDFNKEFEGIEMKAHYALMLSSSKDFSPDYDGINVENSILNWIGVLSKKPNRENKETQLILHSNYKWTSENLDTNKEEIKDTMLKELFEITGFEDKEPNFIHLHRWLYGRTLKPRGKDYLLDKKNQIGIAADWLFLLRLIPHAAVTRQGALR